MEDTVKTKPETFSCGELIEWCLRVFDAVSIPVPAMPPFLGPEYENKYYYGLIQGDWKSVDRKGIVYEFPISYSIRQVDIQAVFPAFIVAMLENMVYGDDEWDTFLKSMFHHYQTFIAYLTGERRECAIACLEFLIDNSENPDFNSGIGDVSSLPDLWKYHS